jgi:RNA polymerase sigma-70 factor (ECF subfamily)
MRGGAFTVRPIRPLSAFAEPGEQDASLVRDCQSGNKTAWEALVQRYTRHVYGLCYRFTGRDCDARDVTQEVFLRVFCKLGSFRVNHLSFVSWLTSLTHNVLVDHYRRNRKQRLTVSIEEQLLRIQSFTHSIDSPDRILAERETSELLQSALLKLAPNLREVIILCDLQEIRHREIALVLGIPEGTVKSRLNRGRSILGRRLRSHGQGMWPPEGSDKLSDPTNRGLKRNGYGTSSDV